MQSRICIVTVNYKGAEDTAACVASLRKSTVPISIVVVDNTPNDSELNAILSPFSDVNIIHPDENLGFGRGNNLGIDWALARDECEFIFLINNDALVETETVSQLLHTAESHPAAGIISPRIVLYEHPSILWYGGGKMDWRSGGATAPGFNASSDSPRALQARYVDYASGCAMFIRRIFFEKVGTFDERFFMYEEDVNLCLRGRKLGLRIWYAPEVLVYHKCQGSMKTGGEKYFPPLHPLNKNLDFYLYNIIRNRLINLIEHTKSWRRILFALGMMLWLMRNAIRCLAHGNAKATRIIISACVDGYKSARVNHG